jgi:uncharacterized protein (TIGR03437 family)
MLRLIIAFLCAAAACMLVAGALTSAQSPSNFTPDAFVAQITNSVRVSATNPVSSFVGDTSANGRFVVIESNGDISTEKTAARNNQDGNREIFLFDYAQRRIFQLTNTRSVLKPATSPSPTPSPSPSPSPSVSPSPTPTPTPPVDEPANIQIEISNNRPMISLEPAFVGSNRTYTIVFSSNAPVTPANFDGTDPGAPTNTDMNQEIWTYRFTVVDTVNLSSGAEIPFTDLSAGTFTRVTDTPASRAPSPGSASTAPFVADDNRDAQISDDGNVIAFSSTRNFAGKPGFSGAGNPDFNPEIYVFNRLTGALTQGTNTTTASQNNPIFNDNPALNSDGSLVAFVSNANLAGGNDDGGGLSNAEIYLASYNSGTNSVGGFRQVTKTKNGLPSATPAISPDPTATANLFTFGRRLSRDGRYIGFESLATDPKANSTNTLFYAPFVYDVTADSFAQLGPRATSTPDFPLHVPTFTDYNSSLNPASVMWTSALNFKSDGTLVTDSTGLNPNNVAQIFLAPLPVASTGPFTRISNFPPAAGGVGAFPSNSHHRFAFSKPAELGGGNADGSTEAFYQLSPDITTESSATISLFTGASMIPVASPAATATGSPTPSPSPSPSPSASPGGPFIAPGLAPGELAVAQFTVTPPPSPASVDNNNASESKRAPALPIELNGTSMEIGSAACGLYAVTASSISFVVPKGLSPGTYPIVINTNGTVMRGLVAIVPAQPDIFTTTNGPGGRAVVCNVTNPATPGCMGEPFNVTSDDGTGTQVPTVLEIHLTGVRGATASSVSVTIGTTSIVATRVISLDQPGFDEVDIILPSTVDRGDLPIVVTVGGATSRPADTAPHITINP